MSYCLNQSWPLHNWPEVSFNLHRNRIHKYIWPTSSFTTQDVHGALFVTANILEKQVRPTWPTNLEANFESFFLLLSCSLGWGAFKNVKTNLLASQLTFCVPEVFLFCFCFFRPNQTAWPFLLSYCWVSWMALCTCRIFRDIFIFNEWKMSQSFSL